MSAPTVDGRATREQLVFMAAAVRQAVGLTLRAAKDAAVRSAKESTRFANQSGETRSSIRGEIVGLGGFVQAGGSARLLENGTRPHTIVAHGKALRFTVNGATLFRRVVHHPGTKARPFMAEARERAIQAAEWGAEIFIGPALRGGR
jgi:hypothetical protein